MKSTNKLFGRPKQKRSISREFLSYFALLGRSKDSGRDTANDYNADHQSEGKKK